MRDVCVAPRTLIAILLFSIIAPLQLRLMRCGVNGVIFLLFIMNICVEN